MPLDWAAFGGADDMWKDCRASTDNNTELRVKPATDFVFTSRSLVFDICGTSLSR